MYVPHKIIIAGAGGIGRAAALILSEQTDLDAEIFIGDIHLNLAEEVVEWVKKGSSSIAQIQPFMLDSQSPSKEMEYIISAGNIILDCLPGGEAPFVAALAMKHKLHYVNLSEYVKESQQIIEMAKGASTGFVLQAGLAPGYINILANQLYQDFILEFSPQKVDKIAMKVGALTKNAMAPHFYGFTWSPIGVATEYVKDAIVIKDGMKTTVPALSSTSSMIIEGNLYEDDFTSGGAADLPDFFEGKVNTLDYKTIRYPGHYDWVRKELENLDSSIPKEEGLLKRMLKVIPLAEEDQIILYVGVSGIDKNGQFQIKEKSMKIGPMKIGAYTLKAIQLCTAAPLLECARILLSNRWQGPILQSQIDPTEFLNGPFVQMVYQNKQSVEFIS